MLKAILIDDEKSAIDALQDVLAEFGGIEIVGTFTNPVEALAHLENLICEIVFLDIEMPGIRGLELAESIIEMHAEVQIVFVTAYDQYAVEAFEVNAVDYLLKPIRRERMAKTIEKLAKVASQGKQASMSNEGRIMCFGAFQLLVNPAQLEPIKWRTNKVRELLAYLVHHRGKSIHKERIVEDLWPNMDGERSVVYLHTCIYQIRKTIKEYRWDQRMSVVYSNDSYLFTMQGIACDTEEFMHIAGLDKEVTAETILSCEKAVVLYRGHYLEEDDFGWAVHVKQKLYVYYLHLVKGMVGYYMMAGMYNQAVLHLQQLIVKDPLQEEMHQLLLTCYSQLGDRAALVDHYHSMKKLYEEELGMNLKSSTTALFRQLTK